MRRASTASISFATPQNPMTASSESSRSWNSRKRICTHVCSTCRRGQPVLRAWSPSSRSIPQTNSSSSSDSRYDATMVTATMCCWSSGRLMIVCLASFLGSHRIGGAERPLVGEAARRSHEYWLSGAAARGAAEPCCAERAVGDCGCRHAASCGASRGHSPVDGEHAIQKADRSAGRCVLMRDRRIRPHLGRIA